MTSIVDQASGLERLVEAYAAGTDPTDQSVVDLYHGLTLETQRSFYLGSDPARRGWVLRLLDVVRVANSPSASHLAQAHASGVVPSDLDLSECVRSMSSSDKFQVLRVLDSAQRTWFQQVLKAHS